jgi:hypothetical protein
MVASSRIRAAANLALVLATSVDAMSSESEFITFLASKFVSVVWQLSR